MASQIDSGTADLTLDTPATLDTIIDPGSYVLALDLNQLANGDILVVTIETKVLTGSTRRVAYRAVYAHVQGSPNVYSVPVPSVHEIAFVLEQTDGVAVDVDWAVIQLDA